MLIAAAQRVEHYEIAGVKTLTTTLGEEVATDAKLSKANESAIATTQKSEG
jgi:ferritin-like metal-binding protein YciE